MYILWKICVIFLRIFVQLVDLMADLCTNTISNLLSVMPNIDSGWKFFGRKICMKFMCEIRTVW